MPRNRQSEPESPESPRDRLVRLLEPIEDMRQEVCADAYSAVGHGNLDIATGPSEPPEAPVTVIPTRPISIYLPWCPECTLNCDGERCVHILDGPYVRTTDIALAEAAPEPRSAFLVWIGATLLALRRARRPAR